MKVHLGNYRNHWISPYTIVEKVVFWKDWETYEAPWVEQVTNILYPICNGYNNVMHKLFPRKKKVRIDYWDTWNADDDLTTRTPHIMKYSPINSSMLHQIGPALFPLSWILLLRLCAEGVERELWEGHAGDGVDA